MFQIAYVTLVFFKKNTFAIFQHDVPNFFDSFCQVNSTTLVANFKNILADQFLIAIQPLPARAPN